MISRWSFCLFRIEGISKCPPDAILSAPQIRSLLWNPHIHLALTSHLLQLLMVLALLTHQVLLMAWSCPSLGWFHFSHKDPFDPYSWPLLAMPLETQLLLGLLHGLDPIYWPYASLGPSFFSFALGTGQEHSLLQWILAPPYFLINWTSHLEGNTEMCNETLV